MPFFGVFLAVAAANIMTPGMGVVMIVVLSVEHGWRRAVPGCLGIALGIALLFALALSGLGVAVADQPELFFAVKVLGSLYILWLGWRTWTKPPPVMTEDVGSGGAPESAWSIFRKCVIVSVTNPQPLVFALSVLPQFMDPAGSYAWQASVLTAAYSALVFVGMMIYAALSARARAFIRGERGPLWVKRISAGAFFLLGSGMLALSALRFMEA